MRKPPPSSIDDALTLVEQGLKAAHAAGRDDLVRRLVGARVRITDPDTRVLVVGEFKQGKSTLVNSLLNAPICPVDDDVATAVPTLVRYGETPRAIATPRSDESATEPSPEPEPIEISLDEVADFVSEAGNPDNERQIALVDVEVPRKFLRDGLALVDTPGVGGLGSTHGALTVTVLPTADAVVLVSDASQEYSEPEIRFLRRARELCPNLVCALTKIDLYPAWRKVADLDRQHLGEQGFDTELFPVSSVLRQRAVAEADRALNDESGYPAFIRFLRREVIDEARERAARTAAADVLSAIDQLESALAAERQALVDPETTAELVRRLEDAKARAGELKTAASNWQVTLNDSVTDLNADVDYDLRSRMRSVIAEAETVINDGDPADWWDEFTDLVEERVSDEIVENYTFLTTRTRELTERVAEHFAAAEAEIDVEFDVEAPQEIVGDIDTPDELNAKRDGVATQGMTAMRGSYGGVLMFGMVSQMAGLAAMNPLVAGMAFFMGRKALRDDRARKLTQRRQEARQMVRKYVDEVSFQVTKDSRDTLRRVHRDLRDTFTERASEVQRSTNEALRAAQRAVEAEEKDREQRLQTVEVELQRLEALRRQARTLVATEDAREEHASNPEGKRS